MTSSEISTEGRQLPSLWLERLSVAAVTLVGCLLIIHVHRWHFTWSVFFLWSGWFSMVVTAQLMWKTFMSAASDDDEEADARLRTLDESRRGDLQREKKALLRSIKDVEFDRDMGKMSDAEAGDILRVYRARAIEIIKELDTFERREDSENVADAIEREVEARLGVKRRAAHEVSAENIKQIEAADRRDAPLFQMLGGLFLVGLGVFVTLTTYKENAGAGSYVLWGAPTLVGLGLFFYGLSQRQPVEDGAAEGAPKSAADDNQEESK